MLMNWLRDEEGQAMVEYGLIIALIAIVVILVLGLVGKSVAGSSVRLLTIEMLTWVNIPTPTPP